MAFGIKTFNAAGKVIIDSSDAGRVGYHLKESGTVTTGNSTDDGSTYSFGALSLQTINANNDIIVFVRPTDTSTSVKVYGMPVNNGAGFLLYSMPGNREFEYLAFELATDLTPSNTGFGLEVYNDNNKVIFSSEHLCTRTRALIAGPGSTYTESDSNLFASLFQAPNYTRSEKVSNVLFRVTTEGNMIEFFSGTSIGIINDTMRSNLQAGGGITYNYYSNVAAASKRIIIDATGITI